MLQITGRPQNHEWCPWEFALRFPAKHTLISLDVLEADGKASLPWLRGFSKHTKWVISKSFSFFSRSLAWKRQNIFLQVSITLLSPFFYNQESIKENFSEMGNSLSAHPFRHTQKIKSHERALKRTLTTWKGLIWWASDSVV